MASTDVQPRVGGHRKTQGFSQELKVAVIVAVIGVIGSTIAALIGAFSPSPPRPPMAGAISSPIAGSEVPAEFLARGKVSSVPEDRNVWLITVAADGYTFPEERIEAPSEGDKAWSRWINLRGRPVGDTFSLRLTLVSVAGEQQIARWKAQGLPYGLRELPSAERPLDDIDAVLRSCEHQRIQTGSIGGTASIVSVKSNAEVEREVSDLTGRYRPADRSRASLWIFVYAPQADRFYPQTHRPLDFRGDLSASELSGGRFLSAARFQAPGPRYELIALLADPGASRTLSRTLRLQSRGGRVAGLRAGELPAGLDEKDCLPVRRHG